MVNIGLNPGSLLGIVLAVAGAALYFLRSQRPALARDHDIFFAAVALLSGGILFFKDGDWTQSCNSCNSCWRVRRSFMPTMGFVCVGWRLNKQSEVLPLWMTIVRLAEFIGQSWMNSTPTKNGQSDAVFLELVTFEPAMSLKKEQVVARQAASMETIDWGQAIVLAVDRGLVPIGLHRIFLTDPRMIVISERIAQVVLVDPLLALEIKARVRHGQDVHAPY